MPPRTAPGAKRGPDPIVLPILGDRPELHVAGLKVSIAASAYSLIQIKSWHDDGR